MCERTHAYAVSRLCADMVCTHIRELVEKELNINMRVDESITVSI